MIGYGTDKLYRDVTRARQLELEVLQLKEQEVALKKKVEELEKAVKPKKRLFGFGKKEQDDYELSQAKSCYNIAVQDLSYVEGSIKNKTSEMENLQVSKEEFTKRFEKKLAEVKLSGTHKDEIKLLESAYLTSLKRKELLPELNKKVWRFQFELQNIILILKQAVEAYSASAASNGSMYSKYERIDKAKEETVNLKKMLEELQPMLRELELNFELQLDTENFVGYESEGNKSMWTDSRFLSLQVGERVKETLKEFEEKEVQTDKFRKELLIMEKNALKVLYDNQNKLEEFVMLSI